MAHALQVIKQDPELRARYESKFAPAPLAEYIGPALSGFAGTLFLELVTEARKEFVRRSVKKVADVLLPQDEAKSPGTIKDPYPVMGRELAEIDPYLALSVSFLLEQLVNGAQGGATRAISADTRDRLTQLLRTRRTAPVVAPPVTTDEAPEPQASPAGSAAAAGVALTSSQEQEVFAVLRNQAIALGLAPAKAELLGHAVLGALYRRRADTTTR